MFSVSFLMITFQIQEARSGIMKEIGDKLRSCKASGGGCSVKNFDQTQKKVMEGNFVGFLVLLILVIQTFR